MLLETLDLRTNDVLIYSKNMFNFNDSFKIIYKNEKIKSARQISYFDVCNYIKDPSPKNLIIYRLLTNVNTLDAYSTKYGYFIKINGKMELIYFDPIFAIKDLRHLRFELDPQRFRFKIQQVGLTSLTRKEAEANFAEVYSFDLKAIEAQNQNDKIFADAIYAFDDTFVDEDSQKQKISVAPSKNKMRGLEERDLKYEEMTNVKKISEDKNNFAKQDLTPPKPPEAEKVQDLREEIIDLLKQALGIPAIDSKKTTQSAVVRELQPLNKSAAPDIIELSSVKSERVNNVFDLFKSTNKSDELSSRERDSIILKFN